jgi:hypothetical protein
MDHWKNRISIVAVVAVTALVVWPINNEALVFDLDGWYWNVICPLLAVLITAGEWLISRLLNKPQSVPSVVEIEPSIRARWNAVCDEFEIDPDELRAEPENFPVETAQIVALDEVRKASKDRELRKQLGARVWQIIRETLSPLAMELDYLSTMSNWLERAMKEANVAEAEALLAIRRPQTVIAAEAEALLAVT